MKKHPSQRRQAMAEFVYEGSKTKEISFPLGGIGTGCVGLSGNGILVDWEIYNRPNKGSVNGYTHFAVKAEHNGRVLDARVIQGDLLPSYSGSLKGSGNNSFGSGPPRSFLAGLPHFKNSSFRGEFPIATLSLTDEAFPGRIAITAFNPLIPLNDKDSSIPGAFFEVDICNSFDAPLTYTICLSVKNPLILGTVINKFQQKGRVSLIQMTSNGPAIDAPEAGDLTVSTDAEDVSYQEYWHQETYKGGWSPDISRFWQDFTAPGKFTNRTYRDDFLGEGGYGKNSQCLLAAHVKVDPGSAGKARFLLTWNFPNCTNYWSPDSTETNFSSTWKNYYSKCPIFPCRRYLLVIMKGTT